MHVPATDHLTCLSCGYDLRAAGNADEKCPECGFLVRDSVAGHARAAGRWAWKVRVGMLLMLVTAVVIAASMLTSADVNHLLLANFAGVKVWAAPLCVRSYSASSNVPLAPGMAGVLVNALGLFLLTTPHGGRERGMSLRRWLRVYGIAAVTASGFIATTHLDWARFGDYSYDVFLVLLLAEAPGTTMLYLYFAQLARQRLRDPQLARRATLVLRGALTLMIASLFVFAGGLRVAPFPPYVIPGLVVLYVVAIVSIGLWAADFCVDLYRALADIEREPARG
jgi:hypothetical protein